MERSGTAVYIRVPYHEETIWINYKLHRSQAISCSYKWANVKRRKSYLSTCISPCPVVSLSSGKPPTGTAVFSRAFLTLYGLTGMPSACLENITHQKLQQITKSRSKMIQRQKHNQNNADQKTFIALKSNAIPPQADGDAIDVPFMSIRRWRVHVGTGATATPGALIQTPRSPSAVGPRLDLYTI